MRKFEIRAVDEDRCPAASDVRVCQGESNRVVDKSLDLVFSIACFEVRRVNQKSAVRSSKLEE